MTEPVRISRWSCPLGESQYARLGAGDAIEIYGRVQPQAGVTGIEAQAASIYACLRGLLKQHGLDPGDVLTERLFFADIDAHAEPVRRVRADFYQDSADLPASTFLQQPPGAEGQLLELQVYIVRSQLHHVVVMPGLPSATAGRLVSAPGQTHIYLQNLVADDDLRGVDFRGQCRRLFERLRGVLADHDLPVSQLIRTWIYLRDLETDYDALNEVRNDCFAEWGVTRLPASTGIEGAPHPTGCRISADVCILWGDSLGEIELMHGETLGEAAEYGSAFSRGLRVQHADRTVLFVSGTASIDVAGNVVHVGDIEGQCHRMLDNVDALLRPHGAVLADTVNAVTYLKERAFVPVFERVCRERGVSTDLLNTVVVADVCRPDWLCEIELTAVLPSQGVAP